MAKDTKSNKTKKSSRKCGEKTHRGGYNFVITDAMYKKELERLQQGVDLLEESRRHG